MLSILSAEHADDAKGVLREGWYNVNYNSKKAPTMRDNPAFKPPAQSRITLSDFDAPINVGDKYIQRLTSYLQVNCHLFVCFYIFFSKACMIFSSSPSRSKRHDQ